jgi:hypothetical protein
MKLRTSREQGGKKKSQKERNFMVKLRSSAKKKNRKTKKSLRKVMGSRKATQTHM